MMMMMGCLRDFGINPKFHQLVEGVTRSINVDKLFKKKKKSLFFYLTIVKNVF